MNTEQVRLGQDRHDQTVCGVSMGLFHFHFLWRGGGGGQKSFTRKIPEHVYMLVLPIRWGYLGLGGIFLESDLWPPPLVSKMYKHFFLTYLDNQINLTQKNCLLFDRAGRVMLG